MKTGFIKDAATIHIMVDRLKKKYPGANMLFVTGLQNNPDEIELDSTGQGSTDFFHAVATDVVEELQTANLESGSLSHHN